MTSFSTSVQVLHFAMTCLGVDFFLFILLGIWWAFWRSVVVYYQFYKILFFSHYLLIYYLLSILLSPFGISIKSVFNRHSIFLFSVFSLSLFPSLFSSAKHCRQFLWICLLVHKFSLNCYLICTSFLMILFIFRE